MPYPSDNVFVTFVRATRGVPYFVLGGLNTDTFEPTDLTVYDPRLVGTGDLGAAARPIPDTADLRVYDLVPGSSTLVGLTASGELRVYDLVTLTMRRLQLATQPLTKERRLPFLAVPGNFVYVTSPGTRQIFEVDVTANPPVLVRTLNTRLAPTGIPQILGAIQ